MKNDKIFDCKGCVSQRKCVFWRDDEFRPLCPCRKCVVKVMCDVACEDFNRLDSRRIYSDGR